MEVSAISSVDFNTIHKVLSSKNISDSQKTEFLKQHQTEIQNAVHIKITGLEFKGIMKNRPLKKFKPLKNSFTKRGDKILLANALEVEPSNVDEYIENVTESLKNINELEEFLPSDKLEAIKTYVYRHGSKDDIVAFLDYELKTSKDILNTLYSTLEYHTGGIADYFIRPIHRMNNHTLVKLYKVIDKNINDAKAAGNISELDSEEIAKWSLIQIYKLQNNSKFINAIKTYKVLSE